MDDSPKATGVVMARMGFKEESEAGEEACWAGAAAGLVEDFEAQEVLPLPGHSTEGWEISHSCDPNTG